MIPEERPANVPAYRPEGGRQEVWTEELIIEKLQEYARVLGSRRGSQAHYRQMLEANPGCGWPAASTITRHGLRFQDVLAEARRREA